MQVEWENALNLSVTHPFSLKKHILQNISVVYMYNFSLILYMYIYIHTNVYQKLRQLHAILQPKVVFQKLNNVLEILKFHI